MPMLRSSVLSLASALLCAVPAAALTLNVSGGQLLGAFDVDVAGTLYDVEFFDGTCVAGFDGCDDPSDFAFTTRPEAINASQALLDQVLVDGIAGNFDTEPELTLGCESGTQCLVITPYNGDVDGMAAGNFDRITGELPTGVLNIDPNLDLSLQDTLVYARWTVVPEPSTALLVLAGLAGLARRARGQD